jgi:hypothetical protein
MTTIGASGRPRAALGHADPPARHVGARHLGRASSEGARERRQSAVRLGGRASGSRFRAAVRAGSAGCRTGRWSAGDGPQTASRRRSRLRAVSPVISPDADRDPVIAVLAAALRRLARRKMRMLRPAAARRRGHQPRTSATGLPAVSRRHRPGRLAAPGPCPRRGRAAGRAAEEPPKMDPEMAGPWGAVPPRQAGRCGTPGPAARRHRTA